MSKKDQADAGTAEAPKKSKKKLMIIIVAAVVVLGGGAGSYFMFFKSSGPKEEPKPVAGAVVTMESVTVNLADGHYLKMKLALQATADAGEEVDGSKAMDIAISQYTDLPLEELSSAKARDKVKGELLEKVGEAYEGEIMDIYFLEFVMQ